MADIESVATYRIVQQESGTYGVEVSVPDTFPTTVTSFATTLDAEAWIARHKDRRENPVKRKNFRARSG